MMALSKILHLSDVITRIYELLSSIYLNKRNATVNYYFNLWICYFGWQTFEKEQFHRIKIGHNPEKCQFFMEIAPLLLSNESVAIARVQ
jgi:hypothetical protein